MKDRWTARRRFFCSRATSSRSVARPLLELKRFGRIALKSGEKGIVEFSLPAAELSFPGIDMRPRFEPGAFQFSAGFSADAKALTTIELLAEPDDGAGQHA